MEHYYIITNQLKDPELQVTHEVCDELEKRGNCCTVHVQEDCRGAYYTDCSQIPEDVSCIIVLGGDGTLLEAARDTVSRGLPLVGVNLGTLGYLAEVEKSSIGEALTRLCSGEYKVDRRMMLEGTFTGEVLEQQTSYALNDVVIARVGSPHVIHFHIYVNGHFLMGYSADGVIVSTPTGSTGYNMSAGGPIVEPGAKLIVITPICAHTLNTRSIILSPEDIVEIEIRPARVGRTQEVEASFDGSHSVLMQAGDRITIQRSEKTTSIIRLSDVSFLEILHRKMGE